MHGAGPGPGRGGEVQGGGGGLQVGLLLLLLARSAVTLAVIILIIGSSACHLAVRLPSCILHCFYLQALKSSRPTPHPTTIAPP